ncbi:exonuclease [Pedobacter metabolipauper]|uniref:Putative mRNA 3-end processing factor n=1 Tax=Pedobacter metabolipauper TaxID=425513 RepID=A0A4R6SS05_9SPHI|nr:exonuclease [Pedobacter metabolipauper]TDQ07014.1 putative mRNA 3-end processing factor [Pedobacter metabolipauper]
MILDDFIVIDKTGLFCRYGDFYLDPKEAVKNAVISHAHGDHAIGGNVNVYCTEATSLFMLHRYKKFAAGEFNIKKYNSAFEVNGVKITFVPAGHILGSAMVLMEYQGVKYLYTGDYKLQPDKTCEPIEFVEADVLITETTFADPATQHPNAEEEISKLNTTTTNIMLGAYSLGKCQRLISLINDHCIEKRILLHHSMVPFVKIYEQMGVSLGKYEVYDRKVMKNNLTGMIYMVPPMVFRSYFKAINVIRVFATGWKHLQNNHEIQLYISDHADWNDIILTIQKVNPQQVWTNHGNGLQLKNYYEKSLVVKLLN